MLSYKKSLKLKELGFEIPRNKILGYWIKITDACYDTSPIYFESIKELKHSVRDGYIPATDAENLLKQLPKKLCYERGKCKWERERIVSYGESEIIESKNHGKEDLWLVGYAHWGDERDRMMDIFFENESLEEAVGDMLIWLKEKGHIGVRK